MPPEMEHDSEAVMDHVALECMRAIESKDKSAFREAFQVLVADVLSKLSMDLEMESKSEE